MTISLIQTSQNRRKELYRFVNSLNQQIDIDFKEIQLIFVDQENNSDMFDELNTNIQFDYIQTSHCSLSHARNIALSFVKGKYVAFPDDDCWYDRDTLKKILDCLKNYKDGIAIPAQNEDNIFINKFGKKAAYLTKYLQYGVLSISIYVKYFEDIKFDENLGVGSPYGLDSGEETDYITRLISEKHLKIRYLPNIVIRHPSELIAPITDATIKKTYRYGKGYGYILKKNQYSKFYYWYKLLRPFLGCLFYKIIKKNKMSRKSFSRFSGIKDGYRFKIKEQ